MTFDYEYEYETTLDYLNDELPGPLDVTVNYDYFDASFDVHSLDGFMQTCEVTEIELEVISVLNESGKEILTEISSISLAQLENEIKTMLATN